MLGLPLLILASLLLGRPTVGVNLSRVTSRVQVEPMLSSSLMETTTTSSSQKKDVAADLELVRQLDKHQVFLNILLPPRTKLQAQAECWLYKA